MTREDIIRRKIDYYRANVDYLTRQVEAAPDWPVLHRQLTHNRKLLLHYEQAIENLNPSENQMDTRTCDNPNCERPIPEGVVKPVALDGLEYCTRGCAENHHDVRGEDRDERALSGPSMSEQYERAVRAYYEHKAARTRW